MTGILKHMVPSSSGLGTLSKNNKVLLFLSASSSEYLIERGNWKERSEIRYRRGVLVLKYMVPSSSGLGHGPLKAVTRVRLSLGSPIQKPPLTEGVFVLCNPRRRTSRVRAGAKRKQAYARSRNVGDDLATLVVATALRIKANPLWQRGFLYCVIHEGERVEFGLEQSK